ncbi:MAG TPA: beta-L-arabinofuranosidase domain-containing protein, partial [Phycisphaerae bacterium]
MKTAMILNLSAALLTGAVVASIVNSQNSTAIAAAPAGGGGGGARGGRGGRGGVGAIEDTNAALTNLALVATAASSFTSGDTTLEAVNDGVARLGNNGLHYGNWPRGGTQWVEYTWPVAISTNKVDVMYWVDGAGIHLPKASRVKYWDGTQFVDVPNAQGMGVSGTVWNTTSFDEVKTTKIRLEMDAEGGNQISTGINEFRVYDAGHSPAFPPNVKAGIDRVVVQKGKTYLNGAVKALKSSAGDSKLVWAKASGPGEVTFENPGAATTTASFDTVGEYVLKLSSVVGELSSSDTLHVHVVPASPGDRLEPVQTSVYKIDSALWSPRVKAQITTWLPHVVDYLEHPEKHGNRGPGGLDNFIEAGKKLRGEPAARHLGYPFANAYVHNAVEAMCVALMVDPQGDPDIIKAQDGFRATLDRWIPIILAAQEPDGYLQTRFTLNGGNHWDPRTRSEHEGYTMGYFLESAISHYNMTKGQDKTLYNAAKKCADCWVANIGPGKKVWYDGHQEMENALVRFSRLVDQVDGPEKGKPYVELAKFLLDSRAGGSTYDQSHLPVVQQYEAVGHAVRAAYTYTGMASVAAEFHDKDYESATLSLWDNIINKKIYITGGIGSGDTSEGFGANYSLANANAYSESCANCGELFFQYNMLLNYHDAKYVDA